MNELQELVKVTMEELKATLVYFGEERGTKSSDFFNMIGSFAQDFEVQCIANERNCVLYQLCVWYWFVCVCVAYILHLVDLEGDG